MADALIQLFADVLKVDFKTLDDRSSPDTVYQWDSLGAMLLVMALEQKYGTRLGPDDIAKMSSIAGTRQMLVDKRITL